MITEYIAVTQNLHFKKRLKVDMIAYKNIGLSELECKQNKPNSSIVVYIYVYCNIQEGLDGGWRIESTGPILRKNGTKKNKIERKLG